MKMKKTRLIFLVAALMVTLAVNSAFGVYYWDVDAAYAPLVGNWADVNNWKATNSTNPTGGNSPQMTNPDGDQEMQIYGTGTGCGVTVTVDQLDVYLTHVSNRSRVYGGATMNVVSGGIDGMGWLRVGERSKPGVSTVNQSGGLIKLCSGCIMGSGSDTPRLTLSDGGNGGGPVVCDGIYQISGGTLTWDKVVATDGQITVGDRMGKGTLKIIGTGGTIDMGVLEMGGRAGSTDRQADGTLAFDIGSDGVSAVQVGSTSFYAGSTNHLITNILFDYYLDDVELMNIVLVKNSDTAAVDGQFTDWNGGSAVEGAEIYVGSAVWHKLTYQYDADGDGANNDIALLIVPEPATLMLLGLGVFAIKRKK